MAMISITDINEKIHADFGDQASEAFEILQAAIANADYLDHPRTIRCIVFLAGKNIEMLKSHIQAAIADPRDVLLWAEYTDYGSGQSPKRLRDFNKTFDQSGTGIME